MGLLLPFVTVLWTVLLSLTPANGSVIQEFQCIDSTANHAASILSDSQVNQFYYPPQFISPRFHTGGRGCHEILTTIPIFISNFHFPEATWDVSAGHDWVLNAQFPMIKNNASQNECNRAFARRGENSRTEYSFASRRDGDHSIGMIDSELRPPFKP